MKLLVIFLSVDHCRVTLLLFVHVAQQQEPCHTQTPEGTASGYLLHHAVTDAVWMAVMLTLNLLSAYCIFCLVLLWHHGPIMTRGKAADYYSAHLGLTKYTYEML